MMFRKLAGNAFALLVLSQIAIIWPAAALAAQLAKHVVIVSIDGGKPAVIQELLRDSDMPNLSRILSSGTVHWSAQTIFPSITLPSHVSMVSGVGPEIHQVDWNTWQPEKGPIEIPTVFSVAKKSGLITALFAGKDKFRHLDVAGTLDEFSIPSNNAEKIAKRAADFLRARKPNMTLVHFPDADSAGHKMGWGSFLQKNALKRIDKGLGELMRAIQQTPQLSKDTVLIITADHGGHLMGHGTEKPDDMNIPWIAWGSHVKNQTLQEMQYSIVTMDTAATALWILGVQQPPTWQGRPVAKAFTPANLPAAAPAGFEGLPPGARGLQFFPRPH